MQNSKFKITHLSNSSLPFLTFWSGSATTQLIAANISLNKGRTASLETFEKKTFKRLMRHACMACLHDQMYFKHQKRANSRRRNTLTILHALPKVTIYLFNTSNIIHYTIQIVEYLDHIVERLTRIIADPTVCIC